MDNNDRHHPSQRQKSFIEPLTAEEVNRIIRDAKANPITQFTANIVQLLFQTGMRVGELRNLKMTDIDQTAGAIRVSSDRSSFLRRVPLSQGASEVLGTLSAQRGDSEYVLGNSAAWHMRRAAMQFRQIALKLTITPHTLHTLRYTLATQLLNSGVALPVLQGLLYNRSPAMTLREY